MPLDACLAKSQGLIGYFVQQKMQNELKKNSLDFPVITFVMKEDSNRRWRKGVPSPRPIRISKKHYRIPVFC